jgi:hypothetical protein
MMNDLLRWGLRWLERERHRSCSRPAVYRRGEQTFVIDATFGRTDVRCVDDAGVSVVSPMWDVLIAGSALPFEPGVGDTIEADDRRWEVAPLSGEGCWRWSDPYQQTRRIHTQEIGGLHE